MKVFAIITPAPVDRVRVVGGQLDFGAAGRIDPTSRAALVLALGLSDEVIALAVTGLHSDDALHEALAYGAKRAIAIDNPAAGKVSDPLADAQLLNAAIYELASDEAAVVFCGAGDDSLSPGVSNPVGAALAGSTYMQYIGGVEAVKVEGERLTINARHGDTLLTLKDESDKDTPGVSLVLGVGDPAIGAHTLPWAGGIIKAYREDEVETMGVGIHEVESKLTLNQLAPSPRREGPELLTDPPAEAAAALVEMLRSRAVILSQHSTFYILHSTLYIGDTYGLLEHRLGLEHG